MSHNAKVEVYYNLHKKCLSVRSRVAGPTYGKVIAHLDHIVLRDATFHVSEPGRQRVIREQRKNVHAVVRGEVSLGWLRSALACQEAGKRIPEPTMIYAPGYDYVTQVTYNPYTFSTFVEKGESYAPVYSAEMVEVEGRSIIAVNPSFEQG